MTEDKPRKDVPSKFQDVIEHCRKLGIKGADERKLTSILGKRAPAHEIKYNSPPGTPRFR